ncbi:hypothetical protein N1851_033899 [Merluccius polli]|uniref:HAT C-terminal dimerisation domain-containing protein n=1 Tax=Merluccius polli TaxID=89951 RepID=A0AA47NP35_MERPO|nr:hypothetical protein N1851_033899 [Merluccius polli]
MEIMFTLDHVHMIFTHFLNGWNVIVYFSLKLLLEQAVASELQSYLLSSNIDIDPSVWWTEHKGQYQRVSVLARKYLCIPLQKGCSVQGVTCFPFLTEASKC